MEEKRTSLLENSFIWFGAAVSIAEILTGTYFAPLGFKNGFLAIILGHIIGCAMLFLAGVVGGKVRLSAMDSVKMSFGEKGGILFAVLNIMQLLGWTGIMIYDGALSANGLVSAGNWVWALVIGVLIVLWVMFGIVNVTKINSVAVTALLVLTVILSVKIFTGEGAAVSAEDAMSFGAAVELSAAMPLSWLPLISDYTSKAEKPLIASAVSAVIYGIVSCWMYTIGMGASIFTGESDLAQIMIKAGLGAGLVIIIFSTVTTTFLDAYSAGISAESITVNLKSKAAALVVTVFGTSTDSVFIKLKSKAVAVAAAVLGTIGAILFNMDDITDFLYLIGSVFAPMTAVLIADFFILKRRSIEKAFVWTNLIVWVIGFVLYRYLMTVDFILGNTLPDMLITMVICVAANKVMTKMIPCQNK